MCLLAAFCSVARSTALDQSEGADGGLAASTLMLTVPNRYLLSGSAWSPFSSDCTNQSVVKIGLGDGDPLVGYSKHVRHLRLPQRQSWSKCRID